MSLYAHIASEFLSSHKSISVLIDGLSLLKNRRVEKGRVGAFPRRSNFLFELHRTNEKKLP